MSQEKIPPTVIEKLRHEAPNSLLLLKFAVVLVVVLGVTIGVVLFFTDNPTQQINFYADENHQGRTPIALVDENRRLIAGAYTYSITQEVLQRCISFDYGDCQFFAGTVSEIPLDETTTRSMVQIFENQALVDGLLTIEELRTAVATFSVDHPNTLTVSDVEPAQSEHLAGSQPELVVILRPINDVNQSNNALLVVDSQGSVIRRLEVRFDSDSVSQLKAVSPNAEWVINLQQTTNVDNHELRVQSLLINTISGDIFTIPTESLNVTDNGIVYAVERNETNIQIVALTPTTPSRSELFTIQPDEGYIVNQGDVSISPDGNTVIWLETSQEEPSQQVRHEVDIAASQQIIQAITD